MEIPDGAVWAAGISLAVSVGTGVKITWTWVTNQFSAKDARVKELEDSLIRKTEDCKQELLTAAKEKQDLAREMTSLAREMTQVYTARVDENSSFAMSLLQANNAQSSEFTDSIKDLISEVRALRAGDRGAASS